MVLAIQKLNFGPNFLYWIKLLYRNQIARIQYAGCRSKIIHIRRGVRQGCPLSPLLFNIVIEMLALSVKQNSEIRGILIEQIEHKMTLYADDVFFFLQHPIKNSFAAINKTIKVFAAVSGYKINELKLILMELGLSENNKKHVSSFF